jgi:hypothetical protein
VVAIERLIEKVLKQQGLPSTELMALGVAVPGVVDPEAGRVVCTPNMHLTGVALGSHLESRFRVPVALGNDCNLGALGETWLGSARNASSAMAILVGTGIGGGFVRKGKLWRGARESAGEVGHLIMEIGGPKCGCGNCGCLEALASRSAIEGPLKSVTPNNTSNEPFTNTGYHRSGQPTLSTPVTAASAKAPSASPTHNRWPVAASRSAPNSTNESASQRGSTRSPSSQIASGYVSVSAAKARFLPTGRTSYGGGGAASE